MACIYEPICEEKVELCQPVDQKDYETITTTVRGAPVARTWRPIPMRLVRVDGAIRLRASDAPWLGSDALIFRRSVIDKLGELLQQYGSCCRSTAPRRSSGSSIQRGSSVRWTRKLRWCNAFSGGKIMRVKRYALDAEIVGDVDIFKLSNLRVSPTFVSERFVRMWASAGLHGLTFNKIWSG